MEPLVLNFPFDRIKFEQDNLMHWELMMLKYSKRIKYFCIAAIILFLFGFWASFDEDIMNPYIWLGIGNTAIAFYFYLRKKSLKRLFGQRIEELVTKHNSYETDVTFVFSEDSVKYSDDEMKLEFKWTFFKFYGIYKGYLIIGVDDNFFKLLLFNKDNLEYCEFERILGFAKAKLEFREIK